MAEDVGPASGKIRVKITCPLAVVADMEADSVLIPAVKGTYLIKPKKAPEFFLITCGQVVIHRQGQPDKIYFVSKGVCEIRRDICAVMAWAEEKTTLNVNKIQTELDKGIQAEALLSTTAQALADRLNFYRFILKKIAE